MAGPPPPIEFEPDAGAGIPAFLRDPVGIVRRGWLWLVLGFIVVLIPALFAASQVPLTFSATTQLLLTGKRIPDEYVPTTILATASEQFQAIKSKVFTRPNLTQMIRETGLYADEWDKIQMDRLADRLRMAIKIKSNATKSANGVERSIGLDISLEGTDPEAISQVVNMIAGKLIETDDEYRRSQSRVTSDFMRREFELADEALRAQQRKIAAFREKYRGSLPAEETLTIAKLDRLESQRRGIILQINDQQLRSRLERAEPGEVIPRDDIEALMDRLAQALAIYTEDHPNVLSLKRQIEQAESGDSTTGTIGKSRIEAQRERELVTLRTQLANVDEEVGRLEALVGQTPKITEEFRALEREQKILQESYDEYLRKLQRSELAQSMENAQKGARLTWVEKAFPPVVPVTPALFYYAFAVLVAIGAGGLLCLLHELIRPVLIDESHLASLTEMPVLGGAPVVR